MRRLAILAPVAVAALAVGGCGSSSSSSDGDGGATPSGGTADVKQDLGAVAQAAAKATSQGSARLIFSGKAQVGAITLPTTGSGVVQFKPVPRAAIDTKVSAQGQTLTTSLVSDGATFYIKLPGQLSGGSLPAGKSWLKVDVDKALGSDAGLGQALSGGQDPSSYLTLLRASGDAHKVGTETIGGVSTTHYRATIDYAKIAKTGPAQLRKLAQTSLRFAATPKVPVDVWVDGQNLVRQESLTIATKPLDGVPGQTQSLTIDIPDYGVDTSAIKVPPASEVVDVTKQTSGLLKGLGG